MLKIAIVGVGWAGTRQMEAIRELGRKVTVACLVDNDPAHLAAKAAELSIAKTYTDLAGALTDPEVDAVSLCTPHALHCPAALLAAAAGKHILVEKPMALNVDDATRMIDAARAHGVTLYVAENLAYAPMTEFLRQLVQPADAASPIGEVTAAAVINGFRAPDYGYPGRRAWLSTPHQGGTGTWMLHGIHSMAQLRRIFGEVATVYMAEHKAASFRRRDLEGTMSGLLTLESGVHIAVVQSAESKLVHNLGGYVIYGDQGSVRATRAGYELFTDGETAPRVKHYPAATLSEYALEMEAFADTVEGVAVGPTTGRSERRTLAIVQAGYESMQGGQPVHLHARFGEI